MKKKVYILEDRSIFYINGLDAKDFLQNLITNDINKVTESSSCFASLLTPQGKFLYEFIIINTNQDTLLIVKKVNQKKYLINLISIKLDQK